MLGALGAEIIKVESLQHYDVTRGAIGFEDWHPFAKKGDMTFPPYERSGYYAEPNRDKYGITLNLRTPEGVDIFKRLVKISDVVVDNYAAGTMDKFGLGYSVLKETKPDIIMLSASAYGATGPEQSYIAIGPNVEMMAGLTELTGHPDGKPTVSPNYWGDPVSALNIAVSILTALNYQKRTGKGQFIDISQAETVTNQLGEIIMDYTMNKRVQTRMGNRHPYIAPHGCYRCKGNDMWVTIAVSSDQEWHGFCQAIGNPPWTKEERFSSLLSRWKNQDELDRLVQSWTADRDHYEVMRTLQSAGIAAGPVLNNQELFSDPHLKERGFFEPVTHPAAGTHLYPTMAYKLAKAPTSTQKPAPLLGQHNHYVLGEILGIPDEELRRLEEQKIIGTVPVVDLYA